MPCLHQFLFCMCCQQWCPMMDNILAHGEDTRGMCYEAKTIFGCYMYALLPLPLLQHCFLITVLHCFTQEEVQNLQPEYCFLLQLRYIRKFLRVAARLHADSYVCRSQSVQTCRLPYLGTDPVLTATKFANVGLGLGPSRKHFAKFCNHGSFGPSRISLVNSLIIF